MPNDDADDIHALLAAAAGLPHGPVKVAACERAVEVADARADPDAGFAARMALVEAGCFGGRPDLMLVAFAWLLARYDAAPDRFGWYDTYQLLWRYKWAVNAVGQFPELGRDTGDELLTDMARRYQAFGSGRHPVLGAERGLTLAFHDLPRARAAEAKYRRAHRSTLSNCAACVANSRLVYLNRFGRYAAAVDAAGPILTGRLTCESVPASTYASLLGPLWHLGRLAEGMHFHRVGYRLVAGRSADTDEHADHVEFLTLTDNLPRAVTLAGKHLAQADASYSPAGRRYALTTYRLLFDVLKDRGAKPVKLALPAGHPLAPHAANGKYPVGTVFAWLDAEARVLAGRFDARNGNGYFTAAIDAHADLKKRITPFPYTPPQRPAADGSA